MLTKQPQKQRRQRSHGLSVTALLGWLCASLLITNAFAGNAFRVDDSASQPIAAHSQLRWKSAAPRGAEAYEAEASTRVNIKLNTQPWIGQTGRIYMALPPLANARGQLRAAWTTQGRLQSGSLVSGGRGLVYQGKITAAMLEDIMNVKIAVDGRLISISENLQFYFEIELY